MAEKDPYKYFRIEVRELLDSMNQGVMEIDKAGSSQGRVAGLLRHAHTLKGAARVVKLPAIADLAHDIEEYLAPYREGGGSMPGGAADELFQLMDRLRGEVEALNLSAQAPVAAPRPAPTGEKPMPRLDTVRLEVGEVDALLDRLSETASGISQFRAASRNLTHLRRLAQRIADPRGADAAGLRSAAEELSAGMERLHRATESALDSAERELFQAHEKAERLRLLQAASLFDFLERAARDAGRTLGKKVRFEASGGDQRLDAPVLSGLQDALLHVVRNAVAHGLEDSRSRLKNGKAEAGLIRLEVERKGRRVLFRCRDDGKGIDPAAIRAAAMARGILPDAPTDSFTLQDAVRLLLRGGVSTSPEVGEVSGRGIGLDAVRATVERLQGEIHITSEPGRGTVVEIRVPYSMSTFPALVVEAGGVPVLIPFDAVRRALLATEADIARSPAGDALLCDDRAMPFFPLDAFLLPSAPRKVRSRPAVVIQSAGGFAAIGVDRIIGVQQAVAFPLPALAAADPVVAGASLDVKGDPRLVLDPEQLVAAAGARPGDPFPSEKKPAKILIVDDSLTTRMLEQSILESAGYSVESAVSAEQALIMMGAKDYGLLLVDVEMPGMNGFELLEALQKDGRLKNIPAFLVTSLSSADDKRRGQAAGARGYFVKDEFDQVRLLAGIRELLG